MTRLVRRYRIVVAFVAMCILVVVHFSSRRSALPPVAPARDWSAGPEADGAHGRDKADRENASHGKIQPETTAVIPVTGTRMSSGAAVGTATGTTTGTTRPATPPKTEEALDAILSILNETPSTATASARAGSSSPSSSPSASLLSSSSSLRPRWSPPPQFYPVPSSALIPLPTTTATATGRRRQAARIEADFGALPPESGAARATREARLAAVRELFVHSWNGYKARALGHDEMRPVTGGFRDPFAGWGATLVDALDALWIVGLRDEFDWAVGRVAAIDFWSTKMDVVPVFEVVIRYMGGLLGAFDVSGGQDRYRVLVDKAVELAEMLIYVFDTPNRMPITYYHWADVPRRYRAGQPQRASAFVCLAEIASLSLEFTRLAQITGDIRYYDAIARVTDEMARFQDRTSVPGLWPTHFDASGCVAEPSSEGGAGALDDWLPGEERKMAVGSPVSTPSRRMMARWADGPGASDLAEIPELGIKIEVGSDEPLPKEAEKQHQIKEDDSLRSASPSTDGTPNPTASNPPSPSRSPDTCFPQPLTANGGGDHFTLGAQADSAYEYLPKAHLLLTPVDADVLASRGANKQSGGAGAPSTSTSASAAPPEYRTMYARALSAIKRLLLFRPMLPDQHDVLFIASAQPRNAVSGGGGGGGSGPRRPVQSREQLRLKYEGSHLACYAGAMVGLAARAFNESEAAAGAEASRAAAQEADADLALAARLTEGCVWAYEATTTGIMPETFEMVPCLYGERDGSGDGAIVDAMSGDPQLREGGEGSKGAAAIPDTTGQTGWPACSWNETRYIDVLDPDRILRQLVSPRGDRNTTANQPDSQSQSQVQTSNYAAYLADTQHLPPGMTTTPDPRYLLRPEAIESVFYLFRLTGSPHWREAGWRMFEAVARAARTPLGASSIADVRAEWVVWGDGMESFWLGETLKYFWLLFEPVAGERRTGSGAGAGVGGSGDGSGSGASGVGLDEFVFNTEAHPLRRPVY